MTADGDGSSRAAAWAGVCPLVSLNRRESEGLDADAGGGVGTGGLGVSECLDSGGRAREPQVLAKP